MNVSCFPVKTEVHAVTQPVGTCASACRDGKERIVSMVRFVYQYNFIHLVILAVLATKQQELSHINYFRH